MELQKLNVKIFAEPPHRAALADFIDVFHGWIQATDGIYHDVADYTHMQDGAGVLLVADDANVSIDESENRRGLLFSQKRPLKGSNHEKLVTVVRAALENCCRLEEEPRLKGSIKFTGNELSVAINDRLRAPNTEETFNELRADIAAVAERLFPGAAFSVDRVPDPRKRFAITLRTSRNFDIRTLLENLKTGDEARG
ncbi:MAG TPA: hypothetical protein VHV54_23955 [Candidatus Binatia bacterium]|nr:hypothetical protein [Candidatus Binatia bacterium]